MTLIGSGVRGVEQMEILRPQLPNGSNYVTGTCRLDRNSASKVLRLVCIAGFDLV
jgi:hypothetical protein